MTSIALPVHQVLTPRLEFPAWLRRIGDPLKMLSPLGGMLTPLGVSARVVSNWWEAGGATGCIAAYQPKGAASLAASYVNLANPGTFNAAPGTAPTFNTATGWTFNGTSQYLTTGIIPSDYAAKSLLIQFANATASGDRIPFGAFNVAGGKAFYVDLYYVGNAIYYDGTHFLSGTITAGNLGVAGTAAYKNGVNQSITLSNLNPTVAAYIGALNNDGALYGYFAGDVIALAVYSANLTDAQMAAVAAAMAAL